MKIKGILSYFIAVSMAFGAQALFAEPLSINKLEKSANTHALQTKLSGGATFDYKVYKEISLPSFPNIKVPVYRSLGAKLNVDGPSILLVHGNSSSSRAFALQTFSLLGLQAKIYLLDLPGLGRASKVPAGPLPPQGFKEYSLPLALEPSGLVEAVITVAKDPDVNADVLVGWSLGGDLVLAAKGLDPLPNVKGLMVFGTSPISASTSVTTPTFLPPFIPDIGFDLSILVSFGLAFNLVSADPFDFNFNALFTDPVPGYAPAPISDAPNTGKAYIRAFFNEERRLSGNVPQFFIEDGFDRADPRNRGSIGTSGFGFAGPLVDEVIVTSNLDIPLAILHGTEEAFVNLQYLEDLKTAGAFPTLWQNEIIQVDNAGHAIQFERPILFNHLLRQFSQDVTQ